MAVAEWRNGLATGFLNEDEFMTKATESVQGRAYHMKKAMEDGNMTTTLKCAVEMLKELSAPLIPPKIYSALYQEVFYNMGELPFFFEDQVATGLHSFMGLYETIQHAGFVLPRLYLMCVAGSACMKGDTKTVPGMLNDLMDMCKGVQHPIRGLFLRSFLVSIVKPYLPDTTDEVGTLSDGSEDEVEDVKPEAQASTSGTIGDAAAAGPDSVMVSITFLLHNFAEMNKLWTRMARMGGPNVAQDDRNERQRQDLSDLVGKNLMLLSQLNGLNFHVYRSHVLPKIMEQIVSCGDKVSQQYLMECLMMTFPDEYHLKTLEQLLSVCTDLEPGVKIHAILSTLMERLASYAERSDTPVESLQSPDAFDHFLSAARDCGIRHSSMPARDVIQMFRALSNFVANVYGNNQEMYNAILEGCYDALQSRGVISDREGEALLVGMLHKPLEDFDISRALALDKFPLLVTLLSPPKRKLVAASVVRAVLEGGKPATQGNHVRMLIAFVRPLVHDDDDPDMDEEDQEDNLALVAALARQLESPDLAVTLDMVQTMRDFVMPNDAAGESSLFVVPIEALAHTVIRALALKADEGATVADVAAGLDLFHTQLASSVQGARPATALKLYITITFLMAKSFKDPGAVARYFTLAVQVYDYYCAFRPVSLSGLASLTNALSTLSCLPEGSYQQFAATLKRYASSLPTWESKVTATLGTCYLYWQSGEGDMTIRNVDEVNKCLDRAASIIEAATGLHRGGEFSSPGPMCLDVLDTIICLSRLGCDCSARVPGFKDMLAAAKVRFWSSSLEVRSQEIVVELNSINNT